MLVDVANVDKCGEREQDQDEIECEYEYVGHEPLRRWLAL